MTTGAICRYCRAVIEINADDELYEHYAGAFLCEGSLTRAPAIQNPTREQITDAWNKSQTYHASNPTPRAQRSVRR